jgi:hypothetical protein
MLLDNISEYFNKHPIISFCLIFIVFIVTLNILVSHNCQCDNIKNPAEHFNFLNESSKSVIFNEKFVKTKKKINFKTTIHEKDKEPVDFYLSNMLINKCINKEPIDCSTSVAVLIDKNTIESELKKYNKDLQIAHDVCMCKKKVVCKHNLPKPSKEILSEEQSSEELKINSESNNTCDNIDDSDCIQNRMFYHDFNVIDSINSTSENKTYLVKGTVVPKIDGRSRPTTLNQHLYHDKSINMLCSDNYKYGTHIPPEYAELSIMEREEVVPGGVIGTETKKLKIRFKFNTRVMVVSEDKNGKTTYTPIIDQKTGKPKMKSSYVGYCDTNTCETSNSNIKRLCLYDDIIHKNILEFEPILVE